MVRTGEIIKQNIHFRVLGVVPIIIPVFYLASCVLDFVILLSYDIR